MDEIAAAAGVSRTVLYRHYATKDALAAACIGESRVHLVELTRTAIAAAATPEDALRTATREALTFVQAHARLYGVFLSEGALSASEAHAEAERTRSEIEEIFGDVLAALTPGASRSLTVTHARVLVGALDRIAQTLPSEPRSTDVPAVAEQVVDLVCFGLRAAAPSDRSSG